MYVISDPSQPHVALGTAATLEALASTLATRCEPNLVVYVNHDGLSHALDAAEQRELDELIQAARSLAEDSERSGK
jgi:predicted neutral ceramidase superfamily lipid hydrolase